MGRLFWATFPTTPNEVAVGLGALSLNGVNNSDVDLTTPDCLYRYGSLVYRLLVEAWLDH